LAPLRSSCGDPFAFREAPSDPLGNMAKARVKLYRNNKTAPKTESNSGSRSLLNDSFYQSILTLRSLPISSFLGDNTPVWVLPITSINEDRFLAEIGLSTEERSLIEGLQNARRASVAASSLGGSLTDEQLSSKAIVRLARDPPPAVGNFQRRTCKWLLRPFPLGLRVSGKNMNPLPCWLAGAQSVALNMSNNDLPIHLHFALFNGSGGYVLKPPKMRPAADESEARDDDDFWPPPCERLPRTSMEILSLHMLPKRGEARPRFSGSRAACHRYEPELSGASIPPDGREPSAPEIWVSLHPVGGFCAVSKTLPLPQTGLDNELQLAHQDSGLNAKVGELIHCVAAEPCGTFVRIMITDHVDGQEVAYESAVLGRLRCGYRIFQMRSMLGTRIELACLFVRITLGYEEQLFGNQRQLRIQSTKQKTDLDREVAQKVQEHLDEYVKHKVEEELEQMRISQVSMMERLPSGPAPSGTGKRQSKMETGQLLDRLAQI